MNQLNKHKNKIKVNKIIEYICPIIIIKFNYYFYLKT